MSYDGTASGAEREPDGNFMLPARSIGDQQARHIPARCNEHEADSPEQEPQRSPYAADLLFLQRNHRRRPPGICSRKLLGERRLHCAQIGLRPLHRDAALQTANRSVEPRLTGF